MLATSLADDLLFPGVAFLPAAPRPRPADRRLSVPESLAALLDGEVDAAAHSLAALGGEVPQGLCLAAVLPRAEVREALVLAPRLPLEWRRGPLGEVPAGARIGTETARQRAVLRQLRPDLRLGRLPATVPERLQRLVEGDFAAVLLPLAALRRLGLADHAALELEPEVMPPALGQGLTVILARAADAATRDRLAAVDDAAARLAAAAEGALLARLGAPRGTVSGGFARLLPEGRLRLTAMLAATDGNFLRCRTLEAGPADAARLGRDMADQLRSDYAKDFAA